MSQQVDIQEMVEKLKSFLALLDGYFELSKKSMAARGRKSPREQEETSPSQKLTQLQRMEPSITDILLKVRPNSQITEIIQGRRTTLSTKDLLPTALLDYDNMLHCHARVDAVVQTAIGTLDAGLWPPKTPTPVLVIHDTELRQRCSDLLGAAGNYDRVVREATIVLEDRIRRCPPFAVLAKAIPNAADQTGDNLVNKLFNADTPVLSVSSDKTKRIAFRNILVGVVSYLRNPSHHRLDDATEWSWAWSTVGLVDKLLADVGSCAVQTS